MPNANAINTYYGNSGNIPNPIFKDVIQKLIDSKLYSSNLDPSILNNESRKYLEQYINVVGQEKAVPLEVLVDIITRSVLVGYNSGFTQAINKIDGATGIGFLTTPLELNNIQQTSLSTCINVHEALILLATEITAIKTAFNGMGVILPPLPKIPTIPLQLELPL